MPKRTHPDSGNHVLRASHENVSVGYFDNNRPPVLHMSSGGSVSIETLHHFGGAICPDTSLTDVVQLRREQKSHGPHTVTGPIFVEGALPGDSLEITIGKIVPRGHSYNFSLPGKEFPTAGALPEEFPEGRIRHFELDLKGNKIAFSPGIEIPLRPFPGIIAVSPPEHKVVSTVPPGPFGGNMDLKELTEGTTLFLPVFVKGALLWVGDAHAAQGNGEVNLTAIESAFERIDLKIAVAKGISLKLPRAETPSHWITMGFHPDLEHAFQISLKEMIDFLCQSKGMPRLEAYSLCSVAVDFHITQVVDGNKGVHGTLAKSIFSGGG